MISGSYILVTPTKDEASYIGETLRSVKAQTIRPLEWVIVSDGSTDGTDEIIQAAQEGSPWIRLIPLPPRKERCFAAVTRAIKLALEQLSVTGFRFVGLLDSDVSLENRYFEALLRQFDADPRLGLAGGRVVDPGEDLQVLPDNLADVPGAVQFFRRECFESLTDIYAIPEGGWDTLTCVEARLNGYRTALLPGLIVRHLKPTNIAMGGIIPRRWQNGVRDYALGYHPLFEAVKCARRIRQAPFLLSTASWFAGYLVSAICLRKRSVPPRLIAHLRQEQLSRLAQQVRLWPLLGQHSHSPLEPSRANCDGKLAGVSGSSK